jgi:hypothetical protein
MSETKKPTDDKAKTTTDEELSEEQLEQVAGGAAVPPNADHVKGGTSEYLKISMDDVLISQIQFK